MQKSSGKFLSPQLPLPCSDPQPYAASATYVAQEKYDGQRLMITMRNGDFSAYNRLGQPRRRDQVTDVVKALVAQIGSLDFTADGELVEGSAGPEYVLFDLLDLNGIDFTGAPYQDRLELLAEAFYFTDTIRLAKTFATPESKVAALDMLRGREAEGMVFKDRSAPYHSGRSTFEGPLFSYDFRHVAKCIVAQTIGRMMVVNVIDPADGAHREIGRVHLQPYASVPEDGAIVDVRYRIALPIGQLFKPEFLGVRTDVDEDECLYSQLVFPAPVS